MRESTSEFGSDTAQQVGADLARMEQKECDETSKL